MAQVIVGNEGAANGTTDVTAVAAPSGTDQRIVQFIGGFNLDSITHTFILIKDKGGTQRIVNKVTAAAGTPFQVLGPAAASFSMALDATNETAIIKLAEAISGTQPDWHSVALNNS